MLVPHDFCIDIVPVQFLCTW